MMAEETKKPEVPQVPLNPRWNPQPLQDAMKIFKGMPKSPQIEQSPNRGTSWMGRK